MAGALIYTPPPTPQFEAEAEWLHLLEVLHRSGALRTLIGLFGRLGEVSDVALTQAETDPGKNLIGAVLFLGRTLASLPASDLAGIAQGLEAGFTAAERVVRDKPPTLFGLMQLAREPDTRRALAAVLTVANRVGGHIGKPG